MKNACCLKPLSLAKSDTIAVLAPASPFPMEKFKKGVRMLESRGFKVRVPCGLFARKGYLAGDDLHRAEMFNRVYTDEGVNGVICARGGFGSIRILEHLDYERISRHPKIFIGFSDITALLTAFYFKCKMVVFHGPTVTDLDEVDQKTIDAFLEAVCSENNYKVSLQDTKILKPGRASGKVAGGNLTTLCHLSGTSFQPSFQGHLLFLEDRGEAPYRIDRMLTQMRMAGYFNGISALILGSFESCGKEKIVLKIFCEHFEKFGIPLIAGLKSGHGNTNITLPFGLNATLDTRNRELVYNEPATKASE